MPIHRQFSSGCPAAFRKFKHCLCEYYYVLVFLCAGTPSVIKGDLYIRHGEWVCKGVKGVASFARKRGKATVPLLSSGLLIANLLTLCFWSESGNQRLQLKRRLNKNNQLLEKR